MHERAPNLSQFRRDIGRETNPELLWRGMKNHIAKSINMDMELGSNLLCSLCHLDTAPWNTNRGLKKCFTVQMFLNV